MKRQLGSELLYSIGRGVKSFTDVVYEGNGVEEYDLEDEFDPRRDGFVDEDMSDAEAEKLPCRNLEPISVSTQTDDPAHARGDVNSDATGERSEGQTHTSSKPKWFSTVASLANFRRGGEHKLDEHVHESHFAIALMLAGGIAMTFAMVKVTRRT